MASDIRFLRAPCTRKAPVYSPNSPFFTLEVHHKGGFESDDDGYYVTYKSGAVSHFDYCNLSFMNISAIESMLEELGYDPSKCHCYMLVTPIDWRPLVNDSDVETSASGKHKRRLEAGEKRKKASKGESSASGKHKLEMTYRNIVKCTKCGNEWHNKRSCGKQKLKRVRTKKTPQREYMDHCPSEVPFEPVHSRQVFETVHSSQGPSASQEPSKESFLDAYKRYFHCKIDGASGSQEGSTVMQRQSHQSQPSNVPNTTSITSRGNKLLFSSQPH